MTWLSSLSMTRGEKFAGSNRTAAIRNVLRTFVGILTFFAVHAIGKELPDAHNLMMKSLAAGEKNEQQLRSYVSRTQSDAKRFEQDGNLKTEEVKTFDDVLVNGFHVSKLVAKNGKPLTDADQQKEDSRIAKLVEARKRETPEQHERRLAAAKEKQEKMWRFAREILDAFDFQMAGEETLNGRKAWVVDAVPHPGYKAKEMKAEIFLHLTGRVWVDQEDFIWIKADARAVEPFALGFSALAKLDKGAHLFFEQTRLADGTWVSSRASIKANARVAMVAHIAVENLTISENFRKVDPGTRLHDAKDDF